MGRGGFEDGGAKQGGGASTRDGGSSSDRDGGACVTPPSVNVDATQWDFDASPTWNCSAAGTTTIDSAAGTVTSTSCSLGALDVSNGVAQLDTTGSPVMVVRLRGLTVSGGHVFKIVGDKPVVFLVAGDVLIDTGGTLDAGAAGTTAGAGGDLAAQCTTSAGAAATATTNGGGGGGFGTPGGFGANLTGASDAAGGVASSDTDLVPLRGGCPGGTGGSGAGAAGAGGGAFEISASGAITIGTGSNPAVLSAAGGGSPAVMKGQNVGSGGGGSGGGILLVSPVPAVFGSGGAARAHGGATGASQGCACAPNKTANDGADGHSADDTAAAGGKSIDVNAATGANGGQCSGVLCQTSSASGANGTAARVPASASGGGGGGGRIVVTTMPASSACK